MLPSLLVAAGCGHEIQRPNGSTAEHAATYATFLEFWEETRDQQPVVEDLYYPCVGCMQNTDAWGCSLPGGDCVSVTACVRVYCLTPVTS